jgi:hypothetical protein
MGMSTRDTVVQWRLPEMTDYSTKTLREIELSEHLQSLLAQPEGSDAELETCVTLPRELYTSEQWFEYEKPAVWDPTGFKELDGNFTYAFKCPMADLLAGGSGRKPKAVA